MICLYLICAHAYPEMYRRLKSGFLINDNIDVSLIQIASNWKKSYPQRGLHNSTPECMRDAAHPLVVDGRHTADIIARIIRSHRPERVLHVDRSRSSVSCMSCIRRHFECWSLKHMQYLDLFFFSSPSYCGCVHLQRAFQPFL